MATRSVKEAPPAEQGGLRRPSFRLAGVPVLTYHGLTASEEVEAGRDAKYWVPKTRFRKQVELLLSTGCGPALLRELWAQPVGADNGNGRVVLTFDDGWRSDYEIAFPILEEAGIRADFFINPAAIGGDGFLTWRQVSEMRRAGMSFQSHSYDHVDLSRLTAHLLEHQIRDSKRVLEDRLGGPVDFIAVPYGFFNNRILDVALREGYRAVCISRPWPAVAGAKTVSRVAIYRHTTEVHLRRLLAGSPLAYVPRVFRSALLYVPKNLLLRFRPATLGVRVLEEEA